ncbi:MAG: alanine racemase [Gammaproteobacteria bacterium]
MTRPAQVVINLPALRHNFSRVRELAPASKVIAVLKADAYGHGLTRVAQALIDADIFGVACSEEAMELRVSGIDRPVLLLEGPFSAHEIIEIDQLELDIVIHNTEQLRMLELAKIRKPIRTWLKIDTGMHRLGFDPAEVKSAYKRLQQCAGVNPEVRLMTHLADASDPASTMTANQLAVFNRARSKLAGECSIANSAGIIAWPETHVDYVRPGLMLYGVSPMENSLASDHGLQAAMSLHSEIIAVREVKKGERIGYGAEWVCPEDMPVGVVAAGYGDGFPRHGKSGTPIMVNDRRTQVVGNPSMDMLIVDLRGVPEVRPGTPVVLWGKSLPVEEVAQHAQTIPYELLCAVHKRVKIITDEQDQNPVSV